MAVETKLSDYIKLSKLYHRKATIYYNMADYDQANVFIAKALLEDNNLTYRVIIL